MNKRNLNIDYNNNNSSKSTFYKSWFNNTNTSPKDKLKLIKELLIIIIMRMNHQI